MKPFDPIPFVIDFHGCTASQTALHAHCVSRAANGEGPCLHRKLVLLVSPKGAPPHQCTHEFLRKTPVMLVSFIFFLLHMNVRCQTICTSTTNVSASQHGINAGENITGMAMQGRVHYHVRHEATHAQGMQRTHVKHVTTGEANKAHEKCKRFTTLNNAHGGTMHGLNTLERAHGNRFKTGLQMRRVPGYLERNEQAAKSDMMQIGCATKRSKAGCMTEKREGNETFKTGTECSKEDATEQHQGYRC